MRILWRPAENDSFLHPREKGKERAFIVDAGFRIIFTVVTTSYVLMADLVNGQAVEVCYDSQFRLEKRSHDY